MSDDGLSRFQDIEDDPRVELLDENRAVISTGSVNEEELDSDNPEVSKMFSMEIQVERDGKIDQTNLRADSMRGLIQKFTFWASSVSDENLNDILKEV